MTLEERVARVEARQDRIEAILRDHGVHEPDCPARAVEKHNAQGGTYMVGRPCECWLSEERQ